MVGLGLLRGPEEGGAYLILNRLGKRERLEGSQSGRGECFDFSDCCIRDSLLRYSEDDERAGVGELRRS